MATKTLPAGMKPWWVCGTSHASDTMPALCSSNCTLLWRDRYKIRSSSEPAWRADAAERAYEGGRVLDAHAPNLVLGLHRAGLLGYLAASDEWVNASGWPLIGPLQEAATKLALDGQLPEFAEWFPAPTEDDRVGAEQAAAARLLPPDMPERAELLGEDLPAARPRPKPRPPWWRRLRRG